MAAGVAAFGRNAWGARLPNALFFALTALAVAGIGARMWDRRTGFLAGIVYATSLYPICVAFSLNTDTLLAFWETLAVLCFWGAERSRDRSRSWRWVVGMWLALGLAFATKGPPALMALVPIVVYRLRDPDRKAKVRLLSFVGLGVFCLAGLTWYVYVCAANPGLLGYFVGDEVVGRVAGNRFGRNPEWYKPFILYLPVLLVGGGLWSWYFWRALADARLHRRAGWRALWEQHGPYLFLAAWLVVPLVVFFLSTSRLLTYVLPLFPAVALLAAHRAAQLWRDGRAFPRKLAIFAMAMVLLAVGGKAVASYVPVSRKNMGALYRLCKRDDRAPGTLLVLFGESGALGLDFYASSPVVRTAPGRTEHAGQLDKVFAEMRKPSPDIRRVVFICRKSKHSEALLGTLEAARISPAETWSNRKWFLARVDLPLATSGGEGQ
jgi:4-amino-4-deoxy-L-arabinose transferase